jgi:hypothetical protein
MYASLMISLLAAFVAMLGKQWLNRYLRNSGGSTIERCGDRQRKCDGLEKWPLHSFVESLPMMLQAALLLLACGLCRHMWSISTPVASTLISLTGLGVAFFIGIVIAGMSSYACPFQTPVSVALHDIWKAGWRGVVSSIVHSKRVLSRTHRKWNRGVRRGIVSSKRVFSRMWNQRVQPLLPSQSPSAIPLENIQVQQPEPVSMLDGASQSEPVLTPDTVSQSESLSTLDNVTRSERWLTRKDLASIRRTNTDDVRCVSWILRNITDPEALDAAIRLAGEIRWFDDGVNVNPPYDLIVSTFEACFDSTRTLYPGSRDRAYYSGRAIMWIHALAGCKSEEFAGAFLLPNTKYTTPAPDPDLDQLLQANYDAWDPDFYIERLLRTNSGHTPLHSQWISNLLLHYSWANRTKLDYQYLLRYGFATHETKTTIPLNATLNRLLVLCTFLGSPVEEEALKVQDKSYDISSFASSNFSQCFTSDRIDPILCQLSKGVYSAINGTDAQRGSVPHLLDNLVKLETRPVRLTEITYEWCSVIYENRQSFGDWERLLLVCLEIGFRHLDFQLEYIGAVLTHTEHHRGLVDVVFQSQESEVIADLLHAWTARGESNQPVDILVGSCAGHLVGLHNLMPFSTRLRRLVIRSVELIGYKGFERVGMKRFIVLLDHLHVTVEDMDTRALWVKLLLETVQTSEGAQCLSHRYWELLVELAISLPWFLRNGPIYSPRIMTLLTETREWSKLECWMGTVWMLWPPEAGGITEEEVDRSMLLLCRKRPGAVQKLEQWMEQWGETHDNDIPESFKRVCQEAHEAAQQDAS